MRPRIEEDGLPHRLASRAAAPDWVYRHVEKHLPDRACVLNVSPMPTPPGRLRYLANTTEGAAVVERWRGGEPVVHLLSFPPKDVVFVCSVCGHRMRISGQELPVDVHCAMCSSLHRLRAEATPVLLARGQATEVVRLPSTRALTVIEAGGDAGGHNRAWDAQAPIETTRDEPYRHGDYTLHTRMVQLTSGSRRRIYFFAKSKPKSGAPCALPDGYEVTLVRRTGLPVLRRAGRTVQCGALTTQGSQCRNTAHGGRYCKRHRAYKRGSAVKTTDTPPLDPRVRDTLPALRGRPTKVHNQPAQCMAVTAAGSQCRSTNRRGSKYCGRHKGYRPPWARGLLGARDTKPRRRGARDTRPNVN